MSGILRNSLRLVGTAKYAPNNSTKYLQCMTLTTNRLNNLLGFQANQISTNFWTTIQTAGQKILSVFVNDEEIKKSNFDFFDVSLSSSHLHLITPNKYKKLILPPTFSTKRNEKSIQPKSNKAIEELKEPLSFNLDKWKVLLDGDELTVKLKDTGETFILKHAVYVKVQQTMPKLSKDGELKLVVPRFDPDAVSLLAKITTINELGISSSQELPTASWHCIPYEDLSRFGHDVPPSSTEESNEELTDTPNKFGKIKLQFPMTVTLEGTPVKIKIKDSDDNFTVYHKVVIEAKKDPNVSSKTEDKKSEIGTLRMALESSNITIESRPETNTNQTAYIKQEVDIEIDFDSKRPSILVYPCLKYLVDVDEDK